MAKTAFLASLIFLCFGLNGCTTLSATDDISLQTSSDPLESINRKIYAVNDVADKVVLRPVASAYDKVLPKPAKTGVRNFFRNLGEPLNVVNNLLQGKFDRALSSTYRFAVNSTVGLLGLIDVSDKLGVEAAPEDLGQTLAAWGVKPGPYIVVPLVGPTNLRDGIGRVTSSYAYYPINEITEETSERIALNAVGIIDTRVQLLGADQMLEEQLDPYAFLKSAFDQSRLKAIYDDNVPEVEEDYDF